MMLFIDAYFTDGALMDSYMDATEAKVKALQELIYSTDSTTGTSTDTLLIGLTQQGKKNLSLVQERLSEKEFVKSCIVL